jgi:hypothetical protein
MLTRAESFIWSTGRVIEQRRFAFLFASGAPAGVRAALDAYRAADGGYAFGLEPDVRGPAGQPITLPSALRVLDEIGALDQEAAEPLCEWLTSVSAADGGVPAVLATLRPYPRPPWLPVPDAPAGSLPPTGPIVGLLLKNKVEHPWLESATAFCWHAAAELRETHPYEAEAAIAFLDHAPDRERAREEATRLGRLVRDHRIVLLDPAHPERARVSPGYAPGEHHFPHDYARTPDSLARAWFTEQEMTRSLDFLAADQQDDGGWPIRWAQWAPTTAVESRPGVTLEALLTLRAWGHAGLS